MNVAKRYCKLILSTLAMALCFIAFSINAWADPISGALVGSMVSGGFGLAGLGSLTPGQVGDLLKVGVDPIGWDDLSPNASIHVSHKSGNKDELILSPNLATAGYNRLANLNSAWGLTPGTIHVIGQYPAVGDYVFYKKKSDTLFLGSSIGPVKKPFSTTTVYHGGNYFSVTLEPYSSSNFRCTFTAFNASSTPIIKSYGDTFDIIEIAWSGAINAANPSFRAYSSKTDYSLNLWISNIVDLTTSQIPSTTTLSPSVNADNDAEIIDPDGRENKITLPSSYLSDMGIPDDSSITDPDDMAEILLRILLALMRGEIDDSIYIDPECHLIRLLILNTAYLR